MTSARRMIGLAAAFLAVSGFGLVRLVVMNHDSEKMAGRSPSPAGPVAVRLLGPASEIRGAEVPAHILAGERPRFFQIEEPATVAVTLPGSKVISLPSKTTFIMTEFDVRTRSAIVVDIALLPLPKSVTYREAISEVRRRMGEMGITPDEVMRRWMRTWPDDSPGISNGFYPHTCRATMDIGGDSGIRVEVRPAADGGWFVVFTFEAGVDARRVLWDPTFKPAVKPTAPLIDPPNHRPAETPDGKWAENR